MTLNLSVTVENLFWCGIGAISGVLMLACLTQWAPLIRVKFNRLVHKSRVYSTMRSLMDRADEWDGPLVEGIWALDGVGIPVNYIKNRGTLVRIGFVVGYDDHIINTDSPPDPIPGEEVEVIMAVIHRINKKGEFAGRLLLNESEVLSLADGVKWWVHDRYGL